MPIFMDVHIVPGLKAKDAAEAHRMDVLLEEEYSCKCMTYWVDELREKVFCLIDAPGKEAVEEMHKKAHGLIPHQIIEVDSSLVSSFLGRIYDPEDATIIEGGLKIIDEPSFRVLLFCSFADPYLLRHQFGQQRTNDLIRNQQGILHKHLSGFQGSAIRHNDRQFICSFSSAAPAISCALAIAKGIKEFNLEEAGLRLSIHAGDPVSSHDQLFGEVIQSLERLSSISVDKSVIISSQVKLLITSDYTADMELIKWLKPQEEETLNSIFKQLEKCYPNTSFTVDQFSQSLAMSKTQLYRKTLEITGKSINQLLREFRLAKAMELLKKQENSISSISFETGFTSPSYFTKCFKNHFGLLPLQYLNLLR